MLHVPKPDQERQAVHQEAKWMGAWQANQPTLLSASRHQKAKTFRALVSFQYPAVRELLRHAHSPRKVAGQGSQVRTLLPISHARRGSASQGLATMYLLSVPVWQARSHAHPPHLQTLVLAIRRDSCAG